MTVYLLWDNSHLHPVLAGVFSSEKKAKAWLEKAPDEFGWLPVEVRMATIEPCPVDE